MFVITPFLLNVPAYPTSHPVIHRIHPLIPHPSTCNDRRTWNILRIVSRIAHHPVINHSLGNYETIVTSSSCADHPATHHPFIIITSQSSVPCGQARPGQPTERSSMLLRLSCRWVKWVYHYQFIIRMVFWLSHYHFCDCMCVPHKTCSCAAGVVRGCFSRLLSSCWKGGGKFEGSLLPLKRARLVHFVCYVFARRFCLFASKWC